ncbi:unnamed protein product [Timema podura]|uniref:Uncharacterized protein n=1 Tax=Timema podura TaxID=61482 RepID=A0ABN7NIB9_TIMPD|nr:unnamed protein product [Timema podura]
MPFTEPPAGRQPYWALLMEGYSHTGTPLSDTVQLTELRGELQLLILGDLWMVTRAISRSPKGVLNCFTQPAPLN